MLKDLDEDKKNNSTNRGSTTTNQNNCNCSFPISIQKNIQKDNLGYIHTRAFLMDHSIGKLCSNEGQTVSIKCSF